MRRLPHTRACAIALQSGVGVVIALAMVATPSPATAMDPNRAVTQYIRDRWGSDRGFPGGQVEGIVQTSDGSLWIGTNKGLIQFDGLTFRMVTDATPNSPPIINVLGVSVDAKGDLLVRLQGPNVLLHPSSDSFENVLWPLRPREIAVTAMYRQKTGGVLMAGVANGLLRYSRGQFETVGSIKTLPQTPIVAITESGDGRIWLATREEGLFCLENGTVKKVSGTGLDRPINALLGVGERDVWIGTDEGVLRWNGTEITTIGIPPELKKVHALSMLSDRMSNRWIGTSDGLLRVNAAGVSRVGRWSDSGSDAISALFQDREGNLWVGGRDHIERLRNSPFITYTRSEGIQSDLNGPVFVDDQDRTWFGPSTGGLYWLKGQEVHKASVAGLDDDVVYSIAGRRDELWIGRQRGGLSRLRLAQEPDARVLSVDTYTCSDGLAENTVFAVHVTRDGAVWAGTFSGGLSRLKDGRFTTYTTSEGLGSQSVSALLEGADGVMWVGTSNGLTSYSPAGPQLLANVLPSDNVLSLFQDEERALWVGTANGLALFIDGRVQPLPGLPDALREQIVGVAGDRNGSLWLATVNRVLRVTRAKLRAGSVDQSDVRDYKEYGVADGLRSAEGVRRARSVVADNGGRIWFSTSGGVSVIDPQQPILNTGQVQTVVRAVVVDGAPLGLDRPPHAPAGSKRITLDYSGVSLAIPERVKFKYKLVGFDRDWSAPQTEREAVYTNLGPGPYEFQVTASNSEGLWNGPVATIAFEVDPAVWQTWWFQSSSVLLLLGTGVCVYRLRARHTARQLNIRFEERLAERTRIAQDLHDTLLQGFIGASMRLYGATRQVPADSPARASLANLAEMMGRVIVEGRDAVRGLRLEADAARNDLEQAFCLVQQEFGRDVPRFRVSVAGRTRPLHPIIRDEVYRIGREALVNAFRHSGCTSIEVEIDHTVDHLRVVVRDDGRGIDSDILANGREGHWGLTGMRERADRIGATVRLWSRTNAGTEVELLVPGRIAYLKTSGPSWTSRLSAILRGGSSPAADS